MAQDGQWTWDAALGFDQSSGESRIGGEKTSETDQQNLKLSLGMNGFIVHPAVAGFRLATEAYLSRYDSDQSLDTERFGVRGDLNLFPRGAYSARLYFNRQIYDYSGFNVDDPFTFFKVPDTGTTWGGRLRFRRGPLRGILLGYERSQFDFLSPEADRETQERQFLDWTAGSTKVKHHLRIERRFRDFGFADLENDYLTVNLDERAEISPTWRWELFGTGIRRETVLPDDEPFDSDDYRVRTRFLHDVKDRDLLDFGLNWGRFQADSSPRTDSYGLSVFYRWRAAPGWEVAPFAQYDDQSANGLSVNSPRAGVSASWSRSGRVLETLLTARTSYARIERSDETESEDESQTAFAVTASIGHAHLSGLREELELEASRNEIRFRRDAIDVVEDLTYPRDGLGTEEYQRARFTLSRHWNSRNLSTWLEWSRRESSDGLDLGHGSVRRTAASGAGERRADLRATDRPGRDRRGGRALRARVGLLAPPRLPDRSRHLWSRHT
jgi:hypothetical protein